MNSSNLEGNKDENIMIILRNFAVIDNFLFI